MGAVWTGITCLVGLLAFVKSKMGIIMSPLVVSASTCLLIYSAIVTAVRDEAVITLNIVGKEVGAYAFASSRILRLTWTAYALSSATAVAWFSGGTLSAGMDK